MRKPAHNEDGTVLLSTLLVLSLMSAVAIALLATLRLSVERAGRLNAYSQADLYAAAAEDFARLQVDRLAALEPAQINTMLSTAEPFALPFENGAITASIRDGSHCLRLTDLVDGSGRANETARQQLGRLMGFVWSDPSLGTRMASVAADWSDSDSETAPGGAEDGVYLSRSLAHRTANAPMQAEAELRALDGMNEDMFQALRPHVCIGLANTTARFNIDTAGPEHVAVLAALLGGDTAMRDAAELIEGRPSGGYTQMETLLAAPALANTPRPQFDPDKVIAFAPERIEVEALIAFGEVTRARRFAFEGLSGNRPRLAHRDWGRDTFRPVARTREEQP